MPTKSTLFVRNRLWENLKSVDLAIKIGGYRPIYTMKISSIRPPINITEREYVPLKGNSSCPGYMVESSCKECDYARQTFGAGGRENWGDKRWMLVVRTCM